MFSKTTQRGKSARRTWGRRHPPGNEIVRLSEHPVQSDRQSNTELDQTSLSGWAGVKLSTIGESCRALLKESIRNLIGWIMEQLERGGNVTKRLEAALCRLGLGPISCRQIFRDQFHVTPMPDFPASNMVLQKFS